MQKLFVLILNNLKTSQFRAKSKHLKPTQTQKHILTPLFAHQNLYLSHLTLSPIHANPFHELGSSLEIVELKGSGPKSFHFENKLLFHLKKYLEHFFNSEFS